jgi:hypothetical protein
VNLLWTGASDPSATGLGTSNVSVSGAGVTLTLDLVFGIDANGLSAYGMDIDFDSDGNNELDIVSFSQLSWANAKGTRSLIPLTAGLGGTQESQSGGPEGQLFGFTAFTLGSGPESITLSFARMVFVTTPAVTADGFDIFAVNERDPLATVFFDNPGNQILMPLPRASVHLIPEPASALLLGAGLAALGTAARRVRNQRAR